MTTKEEIKKELLKKIDRLARKYIKEEHQRNKLYDIKSGRLSDCYVGSLNAIYDIEEIIKKL